MEIQIDNILVKPQSVFINPYTDFGFKRLFGEEGSKDLLIDFLNQLLPKEYEISNNTHFKGIMNLDFQHDNKNNEYVYELEFNNLYNQRLKYFFVVMPRFNKKEEDLKTHKDKWIYFLKNLASFEEIPAILNESIFQKGFELAKIANYDTKQLYEYEQSYNDYLTFKSSMDYQYSQGIEKGIEIGIEQGIEKEREKQQKIKIDNIKSGILANLPVETICLLTNASTLEVEKIRNKLINNN